MENGTAVANTAQTATPRSSDRVGLNRIGCQRIAAAIPVITHAMAAHAITCKTLSAEAECSFVYSLTRMMCTAYEAAATNVSTSPRFKCATPALGMVRK